MRRIFPADSQLTVVFILILACLSIDNVCLAQKQQHNRKLPIELNEETWVQLLQGEWMVDFYASWCPACKSLEPEWRKFAEWSDDLNIKVASADVTANPGLSGRFMVSGLPTIYHVKDGVFRLYTGSREHTKFINFIEDQAWKKVEPISRWRAPDTLQMSFVAYSFRISMELRNIHNYLVDNVGLPYYVSYLIFALCTVTFGTLLGLMIVFVIDQFCTPQYSGPAPGAPTARRKKQGKDSDLDEAPEKSDEKPASSAGSSLRKRANN